MFQFSNTALRAPRQIGLVLSIGAFALSLTSPALADVIEEANAANTAQAKVEVTPKHAFKQTFFPNDFVVREKSDGTFEGVLTATNKDREIYASFTGLVSVCSVRDSSLALTVETGNGINGRCFSRAILPEKLVFAPEARSNITFSLPLEKAALSRGNEIMLELSDADSATRYRTHRALPTDTRANGIPTLDTDKLATKNVTLFPSIDYPPQFGLSFEESEKGLATVDVLNTEKTALTVVPHFAVYRRTLLGERLIDRDLPSVTFNAGKVTKFELPLPISEVAPETYLVTVQFFDEQSKELRSAISEFRFVRRGTTASIQELALGRTTDGKLTADFTVYGSADSGDRERPATEQAAKLTGEVVFFAKASGKEYGRASFESPIEFAGTKIRVNAPDFTADEDVGVRVALHHKDFVVRREISHNVKVQPEILEAHRLAEAKLRAAAAQSEQSQHQISMGIAALAFLVVSFLVVRRKRNVEK